MIGFLDGIYRGMSGDYVSIECSGIGYEVYATNSVLTNLPLEGEMVKLYTYMHIREDGISLYGFVNREEKQLFLKLISVSGVGAKTAIQILSTLRTIDIITSITSEDPDTISSVKGIGKKSAERIILELKDKINPFDYIIDGGAVNTTAKSVKNAISDAIVVLTTLGIRQVDASNYARSVSVETDNAEDIVAKVLRSMGA